MIKNVGRLFYSCVPDLLIGRVALLRISCRTKKRDGEMACRNVSLSGIGEPFISATRSSVANGAMVKPCDPYPVFIYRPGMGEAKLAGVCLAL